MGAYLATTMSGWANEQWFTVPLSAALPDRLETVMSSSSLVSAAGTYVITGQATYDNVSSSNQVRIYAGGELVAISTAGGSITKSVAITVDVPENALVTLQAYGNNRPAANRKIHAGENITYLKLDPA